MANFTAGTSFSDGVTNDVTAAKLNALVADAVPTSNLSLNSTTGTIATFNSTTGTIATLNSTTPTFLGAITASTNTINVGSGQIYKDSSGNVGIGTSSPSARLTAKSIGNTYVNSAALSLVSAGNQTSYITPVGGSLFVSNDGITDHLVLSSSGNLGVGTASPSTKFHVASGNIRLDDNQYILWGGNTNGINGNNASNLLGFYTNSTERLRIDSSGNVGIGTASPTANHRLTISATDARMDVTSTNATYASLRIVSNNAAYASIDTGLVSDSYITTKNLVLQPNSGNVGIGTASPSAQLELSTDSAKKPSTNTWTIASDQRLKTNITNADNDRCYEIVKQVPLKRYTWKSEVYSQEQVKDRSKLGWIAQDVEAVFPKAVGTNRFAYNQVFENVVTPELDSDGNTVLDENGVAKTKTEKRLVSEDVIEDCKDLNSDQIYAAMYGTIQKLIEKVEFLESKVATLEAA